MPKGIYDPILSKTDPLRVVHIKIPTSALAVYHAWAARRERYPAYVMREVLVAGALAYRKSPQGSEFDDVEREPPGGRAGGKRKRAS